MWQTYDYDFDVNGSYYGARKGREPVHVQAAANSWQVEAINHTPHALIGLVATGQVFDATGAPQGSAQQATVDVASSSRVAAFTIAWPWNSVTFPAVAARFVRMAGGTRATQYGFSLYTMSVYGPGQPGTDLALRQPATASSTDDPDRGPDNAFDGDPTTRWSSAYQDNQWLQVDLGSVIDVDRVDLTWETAIAKTFTIETSTDSTTWTKAQNVTIGELQALNALPPAQLAVTAYGATPTTVSA